MKKSIIILCSLSVILCLAVIGVYHFVKNNAPIAIVQQTKKAIGAEVKNTNNAIKTLNNQKVILQKELIASKQSIANLQKVTEVTSAKIIAMSYQIKSKANIVLANTESQFICDSLSNEVAILVNQVAEKDSLFFAQTIIYDSINSINDSMIDKLKIENSFLICKTDTLLTQLNTIAKDNQRLQSKLNFSKSTNRIMSGSLLAIGGYALLTRLNLMN